MGLDTSHDCWHGSYISFGAWRDAVAVAAGLKSQQYAVRNWHSITDANLMGDWAEPPARAGQSP
jgi:hypothetical protein